MVGCGKVIIQADALYCLQLDDYFAHMRTALEVIESLLGLIERKDFVDHRLEGDLLVCQELGELLMLFFRADTDTPGRYSVCASYRECQLTECWLSQ